jgi:hypothetical protein
VSPEGELSTEDLARTGGASDDERPTVDQRRGQEQEPEMPAAGPRVDADEASLQGSQPHVRPQEADPGHEQQPDAGAPREGGSTAAAQRPGGPDPVPDRRGGDGGDQGSVTQPGDGPGAGGEVALLGSADEDRFRQRWGDAQARFVDDPQEAVRSADGLVAELMQSLAQGFSEHKGRLEAQWQRGGDPDTEELRQALQRYRSFFNRLLST